MGCFKTAHHDCQGRNIVLKELLWYFASCPYWFRGIIFLFKQPLKIIIKCINDFTNKKFCLYLFSNSGHFTQVVWKETKEVGFGKAKSSGGRVFVVGSYRPAGNMVGNYKDNVPAPKKWSALYLSSKGTIFYDK